MLELSRRDVTRRFTWLYIDGQHTLVFVFNNSFLVCIHFTHTQDHDYVLGNVE